MKTTVHKREEAQNLANNGKRKNIKLLVMGFYLWRQMCFGMFSILPEEILVILGVKKTAAFKPN